MTDIESIMTLGLFELIQSQSEVESSLSHLIPPSPWVLLAIGREPKESHW